MAGFIKNRWVLFLVLIVFFICKLPHLSYPYYWDESWPYAPAIQAMYHHGVSLLPSAIDPELSRGHPLFFHAIAAAWANVFGPSLVSMHSFALVISLLFLIAIYEAGLWLFNQRVAVMATLLVATQEFFFVQSSFVLFEVLIAFLCFLSIVFYTRDKYILTALCLTMLFYTKESGLIAGFVLGLHAVICFFDSKEAMKVRLFRMGSVAVPCILILCFFLLQKQQRGWYIFPLYSGIIEHSWKAFWYKFRMGPVRDSFYEHGKFYYFLLLPLLAIVATIKNKRSRYLALLPLVVIIYYFVDDLRAGRILPSIPFFILFIASVVYFLYRYSRPDVIADRLQAKFIILTGFFILCFFCFSTMNYYTFRYMQAAIIPLLFLVAVFTEMLMRHSFKVLYYPAIAIFLLISLYSFRNNKGHGDCDLRSFTAMEVQQKEVDFMQAHYPDRNIPVSCASFLTSEHLIDSTTGFLHGGRQFANVHWEYDQALVVLFDNIELDSRYNDLKKDPAFNKVYRYEKDSIWTEIYARK